MGASERMGLHADQTWATDTDYAVGSDAVVFGERFVCVVAHKSRVFGNDFYDARHWRHHSLERAGRMPKVTR